MSALFFLNDRSFNRAADLLKENLQMDRQNPQFARDFALADSMASAMNARFKEPIAWLIYENGLGSVLYEQRVNLPLWIVSRSLLYATIALPHMSERAASYPYLVLASANASTPTALITDMDSVMAAEWDKRYPLIVTRELIAAAIKSITQKQLYDIDPILGFVGAIFGSAATSADLRIWSALPKLYMAASVPIKDGELRILDDQGVVLQTVDVESDKNVILYLKSAQKGLISIQKIYF
jgi:hypothetical protein